MTKAGRIAVVAGALLAGILLAAGESRRMEGAFKPLLKWGARTVIAECIKQLRDSKLDEIFVVLGHREFDVRARNGVTNRSARP